MGGIDGNCIVMVQKEQEFSRNNNYWTQKGENNDKLASVYRMLYKQVWHICDYWKK